MRRSCPEGSPEAPRAEAVETGIARPRSLEGFGTKIAGEIEMIYEGFGTQITGGIEMIYVAVVHKAWQTSGRPDGDWGSFLNKNKGEAITAAQTAKKRWEARGFGPYNIWVGTVTEVVTEVPLPMYALHSITPE